MNEVHATDEKEELEVEIVKETWNSYVLADGSKIRARAIATKILWPREIKHVRDAKGAIGAVFQSVIVVFARPESKGSKNPTPPSVENAKRMDSEEIEIITSSEDWNIYRLPENRGTLKVKMVVSSVHRVLGVYNEEGDPYYIVNSSIAVGP